MDTWGTTGLLNYLRVIFQGHELVSDAKADDFLFFVNKYNSSDQNTWNGTWLPTMVQFVGNGVKSDGQYLRERLTVQFKVNSDGKRIIEDFSIG